MLPRGSRKRRCYEKADFRFPRGADDAADAEADEAADEETDEKADETTAALQANDADEIVSEGDDDNDGRFPAQREYDYEQFLAQWRRR